MMTALCQRLRSLSAAATHRGLGPWSCLWLLSLLVGLQLWAASAQDPDFYFPDPYPALCLGLVVGFFATAWISCAWLRVQLRLFLLVLPTLGLLGWEIASACRDARIIEDRIQLSEDRLLRYHYRPGAETGSFDSQGRPLRIGEDGLWDVPHAKPKPDGVRRIVILGDSVPNDGSIPFPERFHQLLQEKLARDTGRAVEIVNVSCEGYNTLQEVRLLEKVGLAYQPDLVIVLYVLNDPFLQNGGYRRLGNSFVLHRLVVGLQRLLGRSACSLFVPLHDRYAFDLVVRNGLERLALLAERHGFGILLAVLPIVEDFDDPVCLGLYRMVGELGEHLGMETVQLVEAFRGRSPDEFRKPSDPMDVTHPNAEGHQIIATRLAERIVPRLRGLRP